MTMIGASVGSLYPSSGAPVPCSTLFAAHAASYPTSGSEDVLRVTESARYPVGGPPYLTGSHDAFEWVSGPKVAAATSTASLISFPPFTGYTRSEYVITRPPVWPRAKRVELILYAASAPNRASHGTGWRVLTVEADGGNVVLQHETDSNGTNPTYGRFRSRYHVKVGDFTHTTAWANNPDWKSAAIAADADGIYLSRYTGATSFASYSDVLSTVGAASWPSWQPSRFVFEATASVNNDRWYEPNVRITGNCWDIGFLPTGIRSVRKFQTPGGVTGGRNIRKVGNGGATGGRNIRKFGMGL